MQLRHWSPLVKNNLRGFADVELPSGLQFLDISLLVSDGKIWASLSSKPQLGNDGCHKVNANGKPPYGGLNQWHSRELRDAGPTPWWRWVSTA